MRTATDDWRTAHAAGYAALDARRIAEACDIFRTALMLAAAPDATGPLLLGFADAQFHAGEFDAALEAALDAGATIRAAYGAKHELMLDYWETVARIQRDGVGDFAAAAASDSHAQTLRNDIVDAWDARDDGLLAHTDSGAMFPAEAAGFGRVGANVHDRQGRAVSVVFLRPDNDVPVTVTFFVYRYDGHTVAELIDALADRFMQDHPDAEPPEEGDRTLTVSVGGTLALGHLRLWHHRDAVGAAIEHLLLFRFGAVFVECRAQYRPVVRVTALAALERLLKEIVWPPPDS